ncbi:hypothetical protein N7467_011690 [Penicillium canescens]|nr:hypothetical protein N7467_011690 [Penicillium canescens]
MAKQDVYHIHPSGWEGDPEEERFKVSTLDYLTVCTYNNYALFFRLEDVKKSRVVEVLIAGLERTLSQARHLSRRELLCDCQRDTIPSLGPHLHGPFSSDQARSVRGREGRWPTSTRPSSGPYPSRKLLFHLPKSKSAELKMLASPTDGAWVSTYDAFSAFIWRTMSRLRAPVFQPDLSAPLFWVEAVDMRRRLHSPKVAPRIQHNVMAGALSSTAPVTAPTAAEVISEWPLPKLASYIRQLTNSVTQEALDQTLDMVATVRDKTALNMQIDAYPPMSILQTDHRDADITSADFGFGTPTTYRHLLDCMTQGVLIIYPPRDNAPESDEGPEFSITCEKSLKQALIDDVEWNRYFEYRGVDAVEACETN